MEIRYPVTRSIGTCGEQLHGADGQPLIRHGRPFRCDAPAPRLTVDLRHLDRGEITACYCERHGGEKRVLDEIGSDWMVAAPPSVGSGERVLEAGARCLTTREAYVVIRPEKKASADGYVWLAWLGVGGTLEQIENPNPPVKLDKVGKPLTRPRGVKRVPRGTKSFPSREEALVAAVAAWRRNLDAVLASITSQRGGTLAWGAPIEPLPEPVVLEVPIGSNGWDAAVAAPRRGPVGMALISGLRPTGETA